VWAPFLITLREGLEAALIVGIILGVLVKLGETQLRRYVWAGVAAAILVSLGIAGILQRLGVAFEGSGEQLFEGLAMLAAAGLLTWMILWMQQQGGQMQRALEADTREVVGANSGRLLFGLAFIAVVREGIETVLFLTAAAFGAPAAQTLIGGALGLIAAISLAWLIFVGGKQLDLQAFFRWTGVLLVFVAAGLIGHGIHELQEANLLPIFIEHLWDTNSILDEDGVLGSLLKAVFGYNGDPSLLEVVTYGVYLVATLLWQTFRGRGAARSSAPRRASEPSSSASQAHSA
jgi:high-affinity iron transporter